MVRPRLIILLLVVSTSCATKAPPAPDEPLAAATRAEQPRDESECATLRSAFACPAGREVELFHGERAGDLWCELTCLKGAVRDGPALLANLTVGTYEAGEFVKDSREGPWTRSVRHPETLELVRQSDEEYRDGVRNGPSSQWHHDGQLAAEGAHLDGERDGIWREYAPGGQLVFEGTFDVGVAVGEHRVWFANGQLAAQTPYDEVGRPHGEWCYWTVEGRKAGCSTLEHGSGRLDVFDEIGDLLRRCTLRDGKREGQCIVTVHDTRQVTPYVAGLREGVERVYDGECVQSETTWRADVEHGPFFEANCGSTPPVRIREGVYCDGKLCGEVVNRDARGVVRQVEQYSPDGELVDAVEYDEGGEPRR